MKKPYNFVIVFLLLVILISFSGCDRKASGNNVTDETQVTQETETQVTEETSSVEPNTSFVVKQDIAKNMFGVEGWLKANETLINGPANLQEIVVTEDLQLSIDFLRKGYNDLASIVADYPDLLTTKVEEYGQARYTLSDALNLLVYGENTIILESQAIQTSLRDIKTLPALNLMYVADYLVLLNEQGKIKRAYKCGSYYQDIYYGDFLGNDALELAFVYSDSMDTHFFSLNGDVIEPIVLNDLYHEIDTQTQGILNNRNFDVILRTNPNSVVTSKEAVHASVLPEKLYLNLEKGKQSYSPVFKAISAVIDRETMHAVLSCRWMWTNGLQGDITLAEAKYDFLNEDIKRAVQQNVEMRYSDPKLVNRAFEHSEVIIKQNDKILLDTTAAMAEQIRYFNLEKPFVIPEATGYLESTHYYFERSGLSLDLRYFDDMLVIYTLKLTNSDYTLGDAFKVGMSQDALISLLGVPDLVNSNMLSGPTEWSYYVKNDTGERLFNYYYGFKKVVFVFDQDRVVEIRVELFSSPT
jgi:hypothetical protein